MLGIKNISLKYGNQRIIEDVSFEMYKGRILALIGPNGAGKSSIMRIMANLVKPENGKIYLHGKELLNFQEIHEETGFFIEAPSFYKNLSGIQNLDLLQMIRKKNVATGDLIEMVGLSSAANKKVGKFSKGMKQRLGIAQALIGNPDILVLDEPFHGLDPEVKLFLMKLIKDLAVEKNKAILISSHLLSDLENMADDFVLLHKGKNQLSGKLTDFKNEKQKVTFWFENEIQEDEIQNIKFGRISESHSNCWEADLSISETMVRVEQLGMKGLVPYKIEREDLLHSKYMEITE